jgi:hypothetical protein
MAFLGLCADDEMVTALRNVFGANILRVPEERVRPLGVIASRFGSSAYRGALEPLFKEDNDPIEIEFARTRVASVAGKRSRHVPIRLGLEILDGFLQGFGIPSAEIAAHFEAASQVAFSFNHVQRTAVDSNWLGRVLVTRIIDRNNPAAALFFEPHEFALLVIDSIISSRDFTISIERSRDQDLRLDIPTIASLVGKATTEVGVSTTDQSDVTFMGSEPLCFAFSCVRFYLDDRGRILAMPPVDEDIFLGGRGALPDLSTNMFLYSPDRILLSKEPGMLTWTDDISDLRP